MHIEHRCCSNYCPLENFQTINEPARFLGTRRSLSGRAVLGLWDFIGVGLHRDWDFIAWDFIDKDLRIRYATPEPLNECEDSLLQIREAEGGSARTGNMS